MNKASQEIVGSGRRTSPQIMGDIIPNRPGVYFLKAMGYVKIGYTADFAQRYVTIDRMMPENPELLAFIECSRAVETTIHRMLRDHALKNEWYPDCEAVRTIMADVIAGKIKASGKTDTCRAGPLNADVKWASESLRKIVGPVGRDEAQRAIVERAAASVGFPYWRTYDLWYARARRLEIKEQNAINLALGAFNA